MKNTMVEVRLNIDVWIIPTLYIVPLDCIFTILVGSILKISAECIYIYIYVPIPQNYQIVLIWSPNLHHCQIHIKKHVQDVYNIYVEHM